MKLLLLVCVIASVAVADEKKLSKDLEEAITDTEKVLVSPDARAKEIRKSNAAVEADRNALDAVGGSKERQQKLYELSSEIFTVLAHQYEGDPEKMQKALDQAMRNPAAFADTLPSEQKARIRKLADEVEKEKKLP